MTDRSHLTPTATTDKRGRLTTVYRNLAARLLPARAMETRQIPAVLQLTATAADAPLAPIKMRRRRDLAGLKGIELTYQHDVTDAMFREERGRVAGSLALDMIDSGDLPAEEAIEVLVSTSGGADRVIDHLRVVGYYRSKYGGGALVSLRAAVNGLGLRPTDGVPAIGTAGELESATAVVHFALSVGEDRAARSLVHKTVKNGRSTRVLDRQMEDLVRRRPEDVDRIIDYVVERSTPASHPRAGDVEAWLESDAGALGGGWL